MIEMSIGNLISLCIACMALGINIEHLIIVIYKFVTMKGGK